MGSLKFKCVNTDRYAKFRSYLFATDIPSDIKLFSKEQVNAG